MAKLVYSYQAMNHKRSILPFIQNDLENKIVLVSGPRQVGKTTLAKGIFTGGQSYLNFDTSAHRKIIREQSWSRSHELVVFDELHKMKNWKSWLKGIYDSEGVRPRILVTGSARMDVFKRAGDSLAGRHFSFRLNPFSMAELNSTNSDENFENLLLRGGFPEPFFAKSKFNADRWRRSHLDQILRQDLLTFEVVKDLRSLEILVELLAERVGSTLSINSLARELTVSPHTVKRWIGLLEAFYIVFTVTPFVRNVAKAILKEPKIYFYDTGQVTDKGGARLENLVALHLLKRNQFLEDTQGKKMGLHYLKDKTQREVDFVTLDNKNLEWLIEIKSSDQQFSKSLVHFSEKLAPKQSFQLVRNLNLSDARSLRTKSARLELQDLKSFLLKLEA